MHGSWQQQGVPDAWAVCSCTTSPPAPGSHLGAGSGFKLGRKVIDEQGTHQLGQLLRQQRLARRADAEEESIAAGSLLRITKARGRVARSILCHCGRSSAHRPRSRMATRHRPRPSAGAMHNGSMAVMVVFSREA